MRATTTMRWVAMTVAAMGIAAAALLTQSPGHASTERASQATPAASPARQPWAEQGFRDDESWRTLGPPADIYQGPDAPSASAR